MSAGTPEVSFVEMHEIINKLKNLPPECSKFHIQKLFKLGEKHDEGKIEIVVFISEFIIPFFVDFQDKEKILMDITDGINNSISSFDPLKLPTYAYECLKVFKSIWNILDHKEKTEFILKSQYVEVITLLFCQCINLFFTSKKSLLWTLQKVQCFKTVWNELCNILIMVSDADYGPANCIIICTIKKICAVLEICVNGRFTLNGWNFNSYMITLLVYLEVLLGNSPDAQNYFVSNNGIYLMLKWIDTLIKEQSYASKEMLDLIGKIICMAVRENEHCVQYAINENAIQILIKFLEKFKQKVILGVVPTLFFLTADSKIGLEIFCKEDGLSVIKSLEKVSNSNNSLEALTVLRQVVEGQNYSTLVDQYPVENNNLPSSLPRYFEKSSPNVNNTDGSILKLETKNLCVNANDTNQQSCSVKVNYTTPDNSLFIEETYSSDGILYTSVEEVLSSSSTE